MIRELEGGAIDNGVPDAQVASGTKVRPKLVYATDTHSVYSYEDTPKRRVFNQMIENWTPMMPGHEVPDYGAMRAGLEFDDSTFEDEPTYHYLPDKEPTGRGLLADDRETSHWVGGALESIHPDLARIYRGGAVNSHLEDSQLFRDAIYSRPR